MSVSLFSVITARDHVKSLSDMSFDMLARALYGFKKLSIVCLLIVLLSACLPAPSSLTNTPLPLPTSTLAKVTPTQTEISISSGRPTPATCTPSGVEPIPFPDGGKSITGAWAQEPDAVVPYFTEILPALWISQLTLVGLAEWDANNKLTPELALEIPSRANGGISSDGLTITWKLRNCLFWSDGEPLTSEDVKFTWEAINDPANAPVSREGYEQITEVETPDPWTVILTFATPYPAWPTLFTQGPYNRGAILPKHILEEQTVLENSAFIHQPEIGTGPFVVTQWVPGESLTLLPNPNFYLGRPKLDRIQIRFLGTTQAALQAVKDGEADWDPLIASENQFALANLSAPLGLLAVPNGNVEHYFFNLGQTKNARGLSPADQDGFCPFQDERVRQAISLGINREAILRQIFQVRATVPKSLWQNTGWENLSVDVIPYDIQEAAELLDEAGYPYDERVGVRIGLCNRKRTALSFNLEFPSDPTRLAVAEAAASDLAKIGVQAHPVSVLPARFFARYIDAGILMQGAYDMADTTTGYYADPSTYSFQCDSIPTVKNPEGTNLYHLCDADLTEMNKAFMRTLDLSTRKRILDEMQTYLAEHYYVLPLYTGIDFTVYNERLFLGPISAQSGVHWRAEIWDLNR